MISKYSIETAYSFIHQKQRIYQYSTLDWQKDDIEYAISEYVESMDESLYSAISEGKADFLLDHSSFSEDILNAVNRLETLL